MMNRITSRMKHTAEDKAGFVSRLQEIYKEAGLIKTSLDYQKDEYDNEYVIADDNIKINVTHDSLSAILYDTLTKLY